MKQSFFFILIATLLITSCQVVNKKVISKKDKSEKKETIKIDLINGEINDISFKELLPIIYDKTNTSGSYWDKSEEFGKPYLKKFYEEGFNIPFIFNDYKVLASAAKQKIEGLDYQLVLSSGFNYMKLTLDFEKNISIEGVTTLEINKNTRIKEILIALGNPDIKTPLTNVSTRVVNYQYNNKVPHCKILFEFFENSSKIKRIEIASNKYPRDMH